MQSVISLDLTGDTLAQSFSPLRLVAGVVFILSGALAYFRVNLGLSTALVFVLAGVAVIAVGMLGRRARPADVAILIIALIIFAGVASSANYSTVNTRTYNVTRGEIAASRIEIDSNTRFGGITVKFSGNSDLGYQVAFRQTTFQFPFSFQIFGNSSNSISNFTRDGTLFLSANSTSADIIVTLGPGYLISINATAGTGSIEVDSSTLNQRFGHISLSTGTGSIDTHIDTTGISSLNLQTGTGSVSFNSNYLSPSGSKIPIMVSTGTGSLTFNSKFPSAVGVNISASNGFGTISKNLTGFRILQSSNGALVASEGSLGGSSFEVTLSVGTGLMNVDATLVKSIP